MTVEEAKRNLWQCFWRTPEDNKLMKNYCYALFLSKNRENQNEGYYSLKSMVNPDNKEWEHTCIEFTFRSALNMLDFFKSRAQEIEIYQKSVETLLAAGYSWEDEDSPLSRGSFSDNSPSS